jgi:hypothetical protein
MKGCNFLLFKGEIEGAFFIPAFPAGSSRSLTENEEG